VGGASRTLGTPSHRKQLWKTREGQSQKKKRRGDVSGKRKGGKKKKGEKREEEGQRMRTTQEVSTRGVNEWMGTI